MGGQETIKPGDRVILHGEVADFRGDFALLTVDGSAADSGYLSIDCGSFELVDEQRALLHGEITAIRGGFAVAVVDGSLPPGSMIGVTPEALELEEAGELPALGTQAGPVPGSLDPRGWWPAQVSGLEAVSGTRTSSTGSARQWSRGRTSRQTDPIGGVMPGLRWLVSAHPRVEGGCCGRRST